MLSDFRPYLEGRDKFSEKYGDFEARLQLSKSTGHSRFSPKPTPEFLASYYNGGFSEGGNETYNLEAQFNDSVIDVARGVRSHMQAVLKVGDTFNYHDFGCAFGALVYGFQQIGVTATGDEPNESWVKAGNAYCKGALSSDPLDKVLARLPYKLDLITALHVFEHLVDPMWGLKAVKERLSRQGAVYICVPNGHCIQYALGGRRKDPQFFFPMHQQYFTAKSLIEHLRAAGLEPFQLETRWLPDHVNSRDYVYEGLFGATHDEMVEPEAINKALCDNLLGGELFILAGHPENKEAVRQPEIDVKAEKAFAFTTRMRAQRAQAS